MKRTRLMLRPGQRGAKKLTELYGSQLICVRYRYDEETGMRYKTVELIVDEGPWIQRGSPIELESLVEVQIRFDDIELRRKIKESGGRWDSKKRVWIIRYDRAIMLGLKKQIVA